MLELTAAGAARRALPERPRRRSSRAASSSASRSPARSPATRASSSATSRPRRSTSRCRRRSSTCSSSCRRARSVSYLFISHDLGVVRYLSDRIAVLYLGRLMELGPAEVVFDGPHHPYTEALLSAVPTIDGDGRERIRLAGRDPLRREPADRLRLPHALPALARGDLRRRRSRRWSRSRPEHLMRCHIPIEELRRLQTAGPPPPREPMAAE